MKKIKKLCIILIFACNLAKAQWQQTGGPEGGFINSFATIGTNIFAGTIGTGVFLSKDNGSSWKAVNTGLSNQDVTSLVAIGTNLFAGTINSGAFRSPDYGTSWTSVHNGFPNTSVYSLAAIGNKLFAGTNARGIFLSVDSGASWMPADSGLPTNSNVTALLANGSDLYAGADGTVFRSTDTGMSWTSLGGVGNIVGLTMNGTNLFAGTASGGIFLYNGAAWTPVNSGLPSTYIRSLSISGSRLLAGILDYGFYMSDNNGASWTSVNSGLSNSTATAFMVNGNDLFTGTSGLGVFLSKDNGLTWQSINTGLIATSIYSIATNGNNLFAGVWGGGVFRSSNNGDSWTAINSGLTDLDVRAVAVSGTNVFVGTDASGGRSHDDGALFLSTNNGTSWAPLKNGPVDVTCMAFYGTNVFAGTVGGGVARSTDNGSSWTSINSGFQHGSNTHVYALIVSGNSIFAGTNDDAYLSTNNGNTWTRLHVNGNTTIDVSSFAIIGTIWFAGTPGLGVFRSTDSGATWRLINSGLTNNFVYSLASSRSNLFAGTDIYGGNGGVFLSVDSGASWTLTNPSPSFPLGTTIYALTVSGNNLFMGTNGDGAGAFRVSICSIPGANVHPPAPTATTATICAANMASLSAAGIGNLSWYSQATGGTYLGGGTTYITPTLTASTTYYVQDSTCAASISRTAVMVTVHPLPDVTAHSTASTACAGTSVILTGGGASSYAWTGGVTNGVAFIPTATTIYTITGTDANNCSNTATKKITVNPLPTVIANASASSVCAGTSIILTGGGASSYVWTGGVTNGVAFIPTATTIYTVTGTDANNCSNTATKKITVNPLPLITTHLNGVIITADQNGAIYQWLDCNKNNSPIAGATNQSFTATINGSYAILVTLNGCAGTSSCVSINNIGIDKTANSNNEFNVFPNPATNSVTIKFSSTLNNELLVIIKNELGQTVYSESKKDFSGKYVNTIDLGKEAKGIYFVEIVLGNERSSKKIILE